MFSGIVERLGEVIEIRKVGESFRLVVGLQDVGLDVQQGDSVAINGVCLTAIQGHRPDVSFDVVPETVSRTTLSMLKVGDRVNVERALRVGDRIGGHFVHGHVDSVGRLQSKQVSGEGAVIAVDVGEDCTRYMVSKGSVALDGVSLTIVDVGEQGFSIALIPHTLQTTTLGFRSVGDFLNIEIDPIGKMVWKYLGQAAPERPEEERSASGIVLPRPFGPPRARTNETPS